MRAKVHCRPRELLAVSLLPVFWIRDFSCVAVGETKVKSSLRCVVEGVGRKIIPHPVSTVVREPELLGLGVPVKSYCIPNTLGKDLQLGAVRAHSHHGCVSLISLFTNIARGPHRHIEHVIGAKSNVLPPVVFIGRERMVHRHRVCHTFQVCLDVVVPQDAVHFGHIEGTIPECHTVGHVHFFRKGDHLVRLIVFVAVHNSIDFPLLTSPHKKDSVGAQGH